MRIYVSVDLEGINGVVHGSQTQPGEPGYERSLKLMHDETNAVIAGLLEGGARDILVNDAHWDMRNLKSELLNPRATLISGWQKPLSMMSGVDGKADAACFVGYHARAGTARGVLSHTYRAKVFLDIKLNGKPVGETGLNAHLASSFGVPVAFVSGDDALCEEAKEILPESTRVQVKKALSRYSAACPPVEGTIKELKEKAASALRNKTFSLFKLPKPYALEITMVDPAMADAAELIPYVKRVSDRSVVVESDDYTLVFKQMLAVGALGASRLDPHF